MTETDNPKVKEHLSLKDDQILKRITEIDDNERDFQKMFESRELKPVILLARYNPSTRKYQLGDGEVITDTDTTSAGAATFTVPAEKRWKVWCIYARNSTTATYYTLSFNPTGAGDTVTVDCGTALDAFAIGVGCNFMGAVNAPNFGTSYLTLPAGLIFPPGVFTITDVGFQVADIVERGIIYEEV